MPRSSFVWLAALVWLPCFGCTGVSTTVDYDTSFDFSELHSYAWMPQPEGAEAIDQLEADRIHTAVDTQLTSLGHEKVSSAPSFMVVAQAAKEGKIAVDGWGYGWAGGGLMVYHYTDGTLVIDIVDATGKKLLWRGTGSEVIDPNASVMKRIETIDKAVKAILAPFPPGVKPPAKAAATGSANSR